MPSRRTNFRIDDGLYQRLQQYAIEHGVSINTLITYGVKNIIGDTMHVVIVPADRSQVDPWWVEPQWAGRVTVIEMAPGTSYADRNAALVHWGDELAGFPAWPERAPGSQRSGTWQTIRLCRKAGKPVQWQCVMPPHESSWPVRPEE